jgi:hypothetical protein
VVAVVLLALLVFPLPGLAADGPPPLSACPGSGCQPRTAMAQRWAVRLPGVWSAGTSSAGTSSTGTSSAGVGDGGTVPATGQAYVAVGSDVAVVGAGLTLTAYALSDGARRWQVTLGAPPGTQIISVRAWPGVITAGLLAPGGSARTEAVVSTRTGVELRRYPAAEFGGAVAASLAATVVIGPSAVTSYDNATGRVRWRRAATAGQAWQTDGQTLYLAQSAGGSLGASPVTALRVINLTLGTERTLSSPLGNPFSGTLAVAADGAVLFASPAGVTAYSGSTGGALWTRAAAVPEGTDPSAGLVYLTSAGGALTGVDPLTGVVLAAVPGAAVPGNGRVYVVRGGVALGLNAGSNGTAWGYDTAGGRVAWDSAALPWPHFFSDLSGLGGSAAASSGLVVVSACPHLAAAPRLCADPELVAFSL